MNLTFYECDPYILSEKKSDLNQEEEKKQVVNLLT